MARKKFRYVFVISKVVPSVLILESKTLNSWTEWSWRNDGETRGCFILIEATAEAADFRGCEAAVAGRHTPYHFAIFQARGDTAKWFNHLCQCMVIWGKSLSDAAEMTPSLNFSIRYGLKVKWIKNFWLTNYGTNVYVSLFDMTLTCPSLSLTYGLSYS